VSYDRCKVSLFAQYTGLPKVESNVYVIREHRTIQVREMNINDIVEGLNSE